MGKTVKKTRGGQKGNKNALRHGFYAELYTAEDLKRNKAGINIEDEQQILRSKAYRLAKKISFNGEIDDKELKAMNTLVLIIQEINTIERTKILAKGHGGDIATSIMDAIMQMNPYKDL